MPFIRCQSPEINTGKRNEQFDSNKHKIDLDTQTSCDFSLGIFRVSYPYVKRDSDRIDTTFPIFFNDKSRAVLPIVSESDYYR